MSARPTRSRSSKKRSAKATKKAKKNGILEADPFVSIDEAGIGELVRLGASKGRATRPGLHLGVCGEHGGDPRSVLFFASIGLDYVSCSPFRVSLARLAAAQAVLQPQLRGAR